MTTVVLDETPGTPTIYRRAVWSGLPKFGRAAELPDRDVVLRDVGVDRGHLARYDRVCGFALADALPATYPHVLAFPAAMWLMTEADFPFPAAGTVHVGNRLEVLRPIDAAERLDLTVRAADLRDHDRGRQFDIVATATVDGAVVWRGVSTYLRIGGSSAAKAAPGTSTPRDRPAPPVPSAVWRVTPRVGTDYADVSGDHNPIHTSYLGARLFGFRRPIAHGMWSLTRCLAAQAERLPAAYTVDVAFKLPVLLPATVGYSGEPGRSFALHDTRTGRPHLIGTIGATSAEPSGGGRAPGGAAE